MKQENTLLKNTILYIVGNFGSKILSFLIVPVYSYYIDPDAMGYYDVVITTLALIQPIIIFQLCDGVYRWLLESENDQQETIIASALKFIGLSTFISVVVFGILNYIYDFKYVLWIAIYLAVHNFYPILQQATRGLKNNRLYTLCGILYTLIMLSSNLIGLLILRMGVEALLMSQIVAGLVCNIIFIATQSAMRRAIFTKTDKSYLNELIKYSAPLIPNTICWWVVNSSDRYIILYSLGTAFNGIYSIANKFPAILSTLTNVFYMAWQESAITEYNSPNRDKFFSNVFQKYYLLLFSTNICLLPVTRIYIELFMEAAYRSAWEYTGFLFLGAIFSALCSFLGIGYQISKETKRSLATTNLAAIINVVVNIALIKTIGLHAASLATFVAYILLFIIRLRHTKKYFILSIHWKRFGFLFVLNILIMVAVFYCNMIGCVIITAISCVIWLFANKGIWMPVGREIVEKIKRRNGGCR